MLLFSHEAVSYSTIPWTVASQASLSQTRVHWVGDTIQPSHLLSLLLFLLSVFPSIRVFSSELALCIRWPKYWSFSFRISPSNEYSGLISFIIDWFDLLAAQGTLKSSTAPQFESIGSLALSLLYGPPLTSIHDYWKNHSFDYILDIISKVMSLLFNMLFRFVIAFLRRSTCLILWLQSPSTVILEPKKISVTVSSFSSSFASILGLTWFLPSQGSLSFIFIQCLENCYFTIFPGSLGEW